MVVHNLMSSSSQPSLARDLFSMTWPMLFGILSLMSFQLVDSAFIGQLGILPLAAQGFTLPVQMIQMGVQIGLGIAATAVIARALGAQNVNYAKKLGGLVIVSGGVAIALLGMIIWLLRHPILTMLSAPLDVFPVIDSYWPYWLISSWVGAILYFYYSICRANGNTMLPGILMVVTSILNMILDPIFIFTLDLGIRGAAIATIVSFGLGVLVVAPKVMQNKWLSLDWKEFNVKASLAEIGNIMGPAMVSQLLPSVSSMLATKLLAGFGAAVVGAWALGSRFEFFVIVPVLALTMSMPPMIGRMLGAKQLQDVRQLVRISVLFIIASQVLIALLTFVSSGFIANLMSSEKEVTDVLSLHLMLVPISLGGLGVCMLMVSVCNALGKSYIALLISALRLFAFFLPCLWIGSELAGLKGIFIGVLVGNLLAGVTAWFIYRKALVQVEQNLSQDSS
ncbi:MATE family efflux transporter [Marinomonas transparens]|uniref:MATE family efflux transporter n=1 Tax=Marinomonas transparens TaxID=2795388 RepID=A0A934N6H5_9GAMM|nr:MATE family efflux transporter [Marinomonas transparens]MBJ7538061.1 MATE family efflux transporter [Marinomonas transparens]